MYDLSNCEWELCIERDGERIFTNRYSDRDEAVSYCLERVRQYCNAHEKRSADKELEEAEYSLCRGDCHFTLTDIDGNYEYYIIDCVEK